MTENYKTLDKRELQDLVTHTPQPKLLYRSLKAKVRKTSHFNMCDFFYFVFVKNPKNFSLIERLMHIISIWTPTCSPS